MNFRETMSREVEIHMSKSTQQVTAGVILSHSYHCGSCVVPGLQASFIHTGLVLLLGAETKMQTG